MKGGAKNEMMMSIAASRECTIAEENHQYARHHMTVTTPTQSMNTLLPFHNNIIVTNSTVKAEGIKRFSIPPNIAKKQNISSNQYLKQVVYC